MNVAGLGALQGQLIHLLADRGPSTANDLMAEFADLAEPPKYTTVLTVLRSLEKRGIVSHTANGRTFVFELVGQKDDVLKACVEEFIRTTFGGDVDALRAILRTM